MLPEWNYYVPASESLRQLLTFNAVSTFRNKRKIIRRFHSIPVPRERSEPEIQFLPTTYFYDAEGNIIKENIQKMLANKTAMYIGEAINSTEPNPMMPPSPVNDNCQAKCHRKKKLMEMLK